MTGHLPECWYYDPDQIPGAAINDGWPCICHLLRACEKRVLDAARAAVQRVGIQPEPVEQYSKSLAAIGALRATNP